MFEERILQGMSLFTDSELDSVDIDKLDMVSMSWCIVGQVKEDSSDWWRDKSPSELAENGFDLNDAEASDDNYQILTLEWKRALTVRKANQLYDKLVNEPCLWRQTVTY